MFLAIASLTITIGFAVLIVMACLSGIVAGHLIVSLVVAMVVAAGATLIAAVVAVASRIGHG